MTPTPDTRHTPATAPLGVSTAPARTPTCMMRVRARAHTPARGDAR